MKSTAISHWRSLLLVGAISLAASGCFVWAWIRGEPHPVNATTVSQLQTMRALDASSARCDPFVQYQDSLVRVRSALGDTKSARNVRSACECAQRATPAPADSPLRAVCQADIDAFLVYEHNKQ